MSSKMAPATTLGKRIALGCATLMLTSTALAQTTLYRCGVDGSSYSQSPCADGRAVMVGDARSPNQQQQAQIVSRREQALAQQMREQRLADEARLKPAGPAGIRHAAAEASRREHQPPGSQRADTRSRKSPDKRQVQKDPRLTWQVKLAAPKKEKASPRPASIKR